MGPIFQHNCEKTWSGVKVLDVLFRDPRRKRFLDPPGTWGRGAGRQFGRPEPTSGRQFGRPQPTKTTSTGDKRGYKIQYGWWGVAKRIEFVPCYCFCVMFNNALVLVSVSLLVLV